MLKVLPQALIQLLILGSILTITSQDAHSQQADDLAEDERSTHIDIRDQNSTPVSTTEQGRPINVISRSKNSDPKDVDSSERYLVNTEIPFLHWPIRIKHEVPLYLFSVSAVLISLVAKNHLRKSDAQIQLLTRKGKSVEEYLLRLKARVGTLELELEQERAERKSQALAASMQSSFPATSASAPMSMPPSALISPPVIEAPLASAASPGAGGDNPESLIQTFTAPEDKTDDSNSKVTKEFLINALNRGDRQELKAQAMAGLNITKESENAWSTGRTVVTELEEAGASSSYFVAEINAEHWLFPTEKTLRSFTLLRSNKGIFKYEQQVLSDAQLVEPALLERSGHRWIVKSLGVIAVP